MKVGDYVRTKAGINKIIKIQPIYTNDNEFLFDMLYFKNNNYCIAYDIIKSSPNIIDLIEVGDILKLKDVKHYQEVQFIDKEKLYLTEFIYMSGLQKYKKEIEEDLEWIITCEQIESMKYEVGDSNE